MIAAIELICVVCLIIILGKVLFKSRNTTSCDHQWEIVFDEPKKKVYRCTKCGESKEYTI